MKHFLLKEVKAFQGFLYISPQSLKYENSKGFANSRLYDVDDNGVIDQDEMTEIVKAIYMLDTDCTVLNHISAEDRAKNIFSRMDENGDGHLNEEEFLKGCLTDNELSNILSNIVLSSVETLLSH